MPIIAVLFSIFSSVFIVKWLSVIGNQEIENRRECGSGEPGEIPIFLQRCTASIQRPVRAFQAQRSCIQLLARRVLDRQMRTKVSALRITLLPAALAGNFHLGRDGTNPCCRDTNQRFLQFLTQMFLLVPSQGHF